MYYVSKNLGTNHERASTVGLQDDKLVRGVGGNSGRKTGHCNGDGGKSMEHVRMANRLNPENDHGYQQPGHQQRREHNHSESVHMR